MEHGAGPTPRPRGSGVIAEADEVPGVLIAPDKFRGTATAAAGGRGHGPWSVLARLVRPPDPSGRRRRGPAGRPRLAGGERSAVEVEGPLGRPVVAEWLRVGDLAVVEMAQASGLLLAGGAAGNDPMGAATRGTGQLIVAAARAVAARQPGSRSDRLDADGERWWWGWAGRPPPTGVGCADGHRGGRGARRRPAGRGVRCGGGVRRGRATVRTTEGGRRGPGGRARHRLEELAQLYAERYGIDVRSVPGAGAAGGLGEPLACSVVASGRATRWSPSCWASRRPCGQPAGGHRRRRLRRHLVVGQGGGLGAGRRLGAGVPVVGHRRTGDVRARPRRRPPWGPRWCP